VTPDGQRFRIVTRIAEHEAPPFPVVLDGMAALEKP
jgi:hypothetical protein